MKHNHKQKHKDDGFLRKIMEGDRGCYRKNMGVGEYDLMYEELKRACYPSRLGFATSAEGKHLPAILLLESLENKDWYRLKNIHARWITQDINGFIKAIFLIIEFVEAEGEGEKEVKKYVGICIEGTNISLDLLSWFSLLIHTDGELALNDCLEIHMISVSHVPIDVPELMLKKAIGVMIV